LILALVACHDSPRNNPFDPELTPAVELEAIVDSTAGTVTLNWTPYEGQQPFAAYVLERNAVEQVAVEVLDTLFVVDQTTFQDTSLVPDVAYAYRVVTINSGGFEVESQAQIVRLQSLAPVQIVGLEFDATTASAALEWSLYAGADFVAYRVIRSVVGEAPQVIAEIGERMQTALEDSALRGNTEYSYAVAVLTKHGPNI